MTAWASPPRVALACLLPACQQLSSLVCPKSAARQPGAQSLLCSLMRYRQQDVDGMHTQHSIAQHTIVYRQVRGGGGIKLPATSSLSVLGQGPSRQSARSRVLVPRHRADLVH